MSSRSGVAPAQGSRAFALIAPLVLIGEAVISANHRALLARALGDSTQMGILLSACGALLLLPFLGLIVLLRERARPRRSVGRGRLMTTAWGGVLHAAGNAGLAAVFARVDLNRLLDFGLAIPAELEPAATAALTVSIFGALVMLGGAASAFGLLSQQTRVRFFWVFDVALLAAWTFVLVRFPSHPPEHAPDALTLPLIRHIVTTIALIRLISRSLPYLLSGVERLGLLPLVAARHLRSKKSGFLAAISLLSVLAVTVSCMALTTTLSVMGGFRNDLKRKILGNNAHIVIDREHDAIAEWHDILKTTRESQHVQGAAPYVSGEVMLSSASNLATAVLRGIDPETIGSVNDLPRNLQAGSLDYLSHPEKLLDLPPSLLQQPLLPLGSTLTVVGGDKANAGATTPDAGAATQDAGTSAGAAAGTRDAGAMDVSAAKVDAGVPTRADLKAREKELESTLDEIEAFLNEPTRSQPTNKPRDVLPGIVVGKELARALRLYVGDEVNVVAPLGTLGPTGPMPKARPFRVAGIFYSGMYEYDMKFTYVALETGQRFLNLGDAISGIEARVDDLERAPQVATTIRGIVNRKELRVRDWQELNSRLFGALALEKLAMFIALGIAIVVASFCIAGTLTLMVQEKGREVAILKAMGTSDRAVVGVFVIEGGLIGVLGASLGLFLGFMTCFAAEHFGIRMNPEVYYIDRLPVHIDATEFTLTGIAAVLVCLVITVYPALLASRLRPVDALRYE